MGKSLQDQARSASAYFSFVKALKNHRLLWSAGLMTFFIPSVAVGAWYAGSTLGIPSDTDSANHSLASSFHSSDAQSQADASSEGASATAQAGGVTSNSSAGDADGSGVKAESKNGEQTTIVSEDGRVTSTFKASDSGNQVSISITSDQNGSGNANGFSSTHTHSNTSAHSSSNNNNSNTYFNSNSHTFTSP